MNSNQYKQVAQTTMNQALESGADELTAVRAACDNLGVALPNGTSGEVAETLATNDYMGWRACTAEEAQAAANEGVAALYTDGEAVSLVLPDAEVTALGSGTYYTYNAASTTTVISPEEEYVEPVQETEDWHYYADRVVETAESVIGMTKAQVQDALDKTFVNSSWNAEFVLACFEAAEARKDDVIPVLDNAMAILNWYQSNQPSRVHAGKTGIQAGDLVFITDSFNMVYQMGIAASTAATGSVITIIGNRGVNSQVVEELLPTTGSFIGWYVHPDYAAAKPTWNDYANALVARATSGAVKGKGRSEFLEGGSLYNGVDFQSAWCVDFVKWCCKEAGVYYDDIIPTQTSRSKDMRTWFEQYQPDTHHVGTEGIQPGDIIFTNHQTDPAGSMHTAIAISGVINGKVNTINGNWDGIVDDQFFPYNETWGTVDIGWYVHPHYERAYKR